MEDLIKRISELYMKYGIRSVTMDDLARELAISKKTLYQHFKDKEEVVEKVMDYHDEQQHKHIESFFDPRNDSYNAIDQLIELSRFLARHLSDVNHSLTYDLQKYYPAIWQKTTQTKRDYISRNLIKNMEIGIQQGIYSSDLNIEIIAK
ncbi:MAG: TetR/AcrR family transcriptional regulator, partial [Bacteroidales bacterium]|nr:TetR/AcrR family transcriptional regulator [Bacteroidales bacterium]